MLARAAAMLFLLMLGGCTISGFIPDWTATDVVGPEPAYRFVIANSIKSVTGDPEKAGAFEISGPRRIDSLKGASWVICVRTQSFGLLPRYHAVFMKGDHIVDSRLSVM